MRQTLTALLLALTLALSLTGCTRKDNSNTDLPNNGTANNGTANNGTTNNGTVNGGTNSGDGTIDNGTDPSARNRYGDGSYARPGSNGATSSDSYDTLPGRSYEQMLRDGRVHDSDGFLTDGENSVTEW